MNIIKYAPIIPGTVLEKISMGNVTGIEFLDKIFYITDGIMLAQIKEISGIDGSTLQNWVKRRWIPNPKNKKYSKDTVARILIVNMMRKSLSLEKIDFLLKYINGDLNCCDDDIIPESVLYGYICDIIERMMEIEDASGETLRGCIEKYTEKYEEKVTGARRRLISALEIIVVSYYSTMLQLYCNELYEKL
ncbi:MAG: DUF1836 domain-containing protein [Oscillospiraceae bacterium]|nr:DUF1836 domain-containing protein [Oscillospiraceae bacterium]